MVESNSPKLNQTNNSKKNMQEQHLKFQTCSIKIQIKLEEKKKEINQADSIS